MAGNSESGTITVFAGIDPGQQTPVSFFSLMQARSLVWTNDQFTSIQQIKSSPEEIIHFIV